MTTLSKEDVVRMADKIYWPYGSPVTYDGLQAFAELARSDLVAENERLKFALADTEALELGTAETLTATRTALAAAEAREAKFIAALDQAESALGEIRDFPLTYLEVSEALSQPRDDSALREMIAGVYEKCAEVCENSDRYRGDYFAAKIRELAEKAKA